MQYLTISKNNIINKLPLFLILFFLISITIIFFNVGFIITPDSTGYLEIAQNVFKGKGPVTDNGKIITHWGFIYPMLLGITAKIFHLKLLQASYLLSMIFTVTIYLDTKSIFERTIENKENVGIFHLLFLFIIYVSGIGISSVSVMSEYLYIAFTFKIINFIHKVFNSHNVTRKLIILSIICVIIFYTRFIGFAVFISFIAFYVAYNRNYVKLLVAFILPYALCVLAWNLFVNSHKNQETGFNRIAKYHPILHSKFIQLVNYFNSVFYFNHNNLNETTKFILFLIILVLFSTLIFILINKYLSIKINTNLYLVFLVIFYNSILFTTIMFFDASTPLDFRLLSPTLPMFIILFIDFMVNREVKYIKICLMVLTYMAIVGAYNNFNRYKILFTDGEGLRSKTYTKHENIDKLRKLKIIFKRKQTIYSNGPDYLKANFKTTKFQFHLLPMKYYPTSKVINPNYKKQMNDVFQKLKNDSNYHLVYFSKLTWRNYLASGLELEQMVKDVLMISKIEKAPDGSWIVFSLNQKMIY